MLLQLEIKNYAIIEHTVIEFDKGLNIITGETGAGKSILLGALGLTLGKRADSKALYNQESKCVVEATFQVAQKRFHSFFEENELDFEATTVVRREISTSGKSRAFINDTPVTLQILKSLTEQLVNLHSQHETLTLNDQGFQLDVVDFVAQNEAVKKTYQTTFREWQAQKNELKNLVEANLLVQRDHEYHLFQYNEIEEAQLDELNLHEMEQELSTLSNAEKIKSNLYTASQILDNEQQSALQMLQDAQAALTEITSFHNDYENLHNRLESAILEIQDAKNEIENLAESTDFDQERIAFLTEKVNIVNKLTQKHQVNTIEELLLIKDDLASKTASLETTEKKITALEKSIATLEKQLSKEVKSLAESRREAIPTIEQQIAKTLRNIGMPNASFVIAQKEKENYSLSGKDELVFLFTSNKGFEPQPIHKVASGGELSRVMLATKALIANYTALPTLIFDEIDTGISGEVAAKVSEVFQAMSKNHQLIAITHLPQIAAKANRHFYIYKAEKDNKTITKIAALKEEKHVKAIARMLSGENITEASMDNARQLIG